MSWSMNTSVGRGLVYPMVYEHCNTDKQSSVFKHLRNSGHNGEPNDFKILGKGYKTKHDRRIAEALFIKDKKPTLNEQVLSYRLSLFE